MRRGAPFVWFDLTADGGEQVGEFYQDLFGWPVGPGARDYAGWFVDGGQPLAGVAAAGAAPTGRWVPYVAVDDFGRGREAGGRVVPPRGLTHSLTWPAPDRAARPSDDLGDDDASVQ